MVLIKYSGSGKVKSLRFVVNQGFKNTDSQSSFEVLHFSQCKTPQSHYGSCAMAPQAALHDEGCKQELLRRVRTGQAALGQDGI